MRADGWGEGSGTMLLSYSLGVLPWELYPHRFPTHSGALSVSNSASTQGREVKVGSRCQGPLWQPCTLQVVVLSPPCLACKVFSFGGGCMRPPLSLLG